MEAVNLIGVKTDGSATLLGTVPMPPEMKRREIAVEHFGSLSPDESGNDGDLCLWALEQYHDWLVQQGWQAPVLSIAPAP